jgi:LuxR family maltose regulon positive regulatory protein
MLHLKGEVPRQRIDLVERAHLIGVMNSLTSARLMLIIAPAGYGKTTILTQWSDAAKAAGNLIAWLTLDEDDTVPRQFLSGVVFALSQAGVELGGLVSQAEQGLVELSVGACLDLIVDGLREDGRPCFLILDDYHRSASPELDKLLSRMAQMLRGETRLIVSARARPNIGVPKLLASGFASELSADSLRLTEDESRRLLDTEMSDTDFATVFYHTEGWPVALQLARLVLQGEKGVSAAIRQLTSRGSHLSTYLADQVLGNLTPEVVDFLLETSILERFNAELTDAVRGRNDSWSFMDQLEPLQSLITPLDDDGVWYRYHHLFAEYLRHLLRQRRPGDVARLHERASKAFQGNGLLVEAVRHAAAAGDFARCAELIETAGGWRMVLYGGKNQLAGALRHIPGAARRAYPALLAAESYLKIKDGDLVGARSTFELVPASLRSENPDWSQPTDEARALFNVGVLLRVYEDNGIDGALLDRLEQIRSRIPISESLTRGVLEAGEALSALAVGRLRLAENLAQCSMTSMRGASTVLGLNYALLHAGLSTLMQAKLADAEAYLTQARAMAEENFGEDSGLKSIADILWVSLQLWRTGEVGMPDAAFARAFQHAREFDGWSDIYIIGLDARFRSAWAPCDPVAMKQVISEGYDLVRGRGIRRLDLQVRGQSLLLATIVGAKLEASAIGRDLRYHFPIGCWRTDPSLWRPYQDCGFALTRWLEVEACGEALKIATDLIDCAGAMDAAIFEIRARAIRARLYDRLGRKREAIADLTWAIEAAAPNKIVLPFLEQPQLSPLIQEIRKDYRNRGCAPITEVFLSELVTRLGSGSAGVRDQAAGIAGLSPREREVVHELQLGSTNKEIARALDMTEHTVKFHLRNIFNKLGVDRRARVLAKVPARSSFGP